MEQELSTGAVEEVWADLLLHMLAAVAADPAPAAASIVVICTFRVVRLPGDTKL